jgi:PIN domain nuclease of toxin-antitoxin system
MRLLLDTHTVLWALDDRPRLRCAGDETGLEPIGPG